MYWHNLEWDDPKYNPKIVKPFSVSSKNKYISNSDRMANFVGKSRLKELDIIDLFQRKHMNEAMEAELTEMDSRPDNFAVSGDASVDEAIPIGIRK